MKVYRNHEGYKDPTAGKALRKAWKAHKKKQLKTSAMLYSLGDLPAFKKAVADLKKYK